MSQPKPRYCRQRNHGRRDQAYTTIAGRRVHLGNYNTVESKERFRQVVAEWRASGGAAPVKARDTIRMVHACLRYLRHAKSYYVDRDGQPAKELHHIRVVIRDFRDMFGRTPISQFSPRCMKALMQTWIDRDWSRTYINDMAGRARRIIKWCVQEELCSSTVYEAVRCVEGLRKGRSAAREGRKITPVLDAHVDAIQPFVSAQIWAVIQLLRLTGARPSEILTMRGSDLTMVDDVWEFAPAEHKNGWRDQDRTILLGPRCCEVIRPFLKSDLSKYLFSPREATKSRHAACKTHRRQPVRRPRTARRIRDRYDRDGLRRAVQRACDQAGVARWHPYQLRHGRATQVRRSFGLEAAQAVLGQVDIRSSQIYAARNDELAREVARRIG